MGLLFYDDVLKIVRQIQRQVTSLALAGRSLILLPSWGWLAMV